MPSPAAIHFRDLTLGYGRHPAVHHLDGTLQPGSLTAIVGPNGAGKSTLLKGIIGAIRPLQGRVEFDNSRRDAIAYLPQQSHIDREFPVRVFDLVSLGLWRRLGSFGGVGRDLEQRVSMALCAVGLEGFERRPIVSLSGGQLQRTLFARLLLQDAPVILLDEPFNAVDARTARDLLDLIKRWHGELRTVVCVLHDLELVRGHMPEVLLLAREPIAWGATSEVLSARNLLSARRLSEAWDDRAAPCERSGPP